MWSDPKDRLHRYSEGTKLSITQEWVSALAVIPGLKLVYIYRYDTDGPFQDPGEATLQLVSMIMNARISKE